MTTTNPYQDQDRAFDAFDQFDRFGFVMFPQQAAIYQQLAERVRGKIVLEAGCGNGVGSALLERTASRFWATDKLERNVRFARCLYPWIEFAAWDICQPYHRRVGTVVCVEAIEHAAYPREAVRNLVGATHRELWISTPNGNGRPRPPENPFHVIEYTPAEIVAMLREEPRVGNIEVLGWEDFAPLPLDTKIDTLVYRVEMKCP